MKGRSFVAGAAAILALSVVGTARAASAASFATNWTQWGFNAQHTGYNPSETVLTRANVGHLVTAFITPLDPGYSYDGLGGDPILAGGVVYLSASQDGIVEGINGATGAVTMDVAACGASTTDPAFASGKIWVGLDDPGVARISTSGATVSCINFNGSLCCMVEPPSAGNGTVYATDDSGTLYAINAMTGTLRWSRCCNYYSSASLSADGSELFVSGGPGGGYVYALKAATGAVIWSHFLDTCGESSIAVSGSMLYVGGCNLYGLAAATGTIKWHSTKLGPDVMTPAVAGGLVIASAPMGANYQGIAAFDSTTGKRIWFDNVDVADPPTIANGVVYLDAEDGLSLIMLNSSTGAQLGSLAPPSGSYVGAAIPVDGHVYVNTGSALIAYKP
jgi:outer membrane protein assembly factor BamB